MNFFLKSVSYILHPLLMPIFGALIYFITAPRFIPNEIILNKVSILVIITIIIPIITFFLLKNLGLVSSIHIKDVKQRKIPLLIQSLLLILIIKLVIDVYHFPALYFFFLGVLFSLLSATFLVLFSIKASLHMIGISGIAIFVITLSIHFGSNQTLLIAFLMILNGLVATSRLHCKAHTFNELVIGSVVGIFPQIILANLWL